VQGDSSPLPTVVHDLEYPGLACGEGDLAQRDALEGLALAVVISDLEPCLPELAVPPDTVQQLMNR
jgi:hypothetical protein